MSVVNEKGYDFGNICRHCDQETVQPIECIVSGTIPKWAEGSYVYNGPGITKIGKASYKHCFDSASIIQKVTVSASGSASYMSRFLRSQAYKRNMKAGTITVGEFGTAPHVPDSEKGFFSKLRKMTDMESVLSDNAVVSIVNIAGKHYALGETPFMQELDIATLETKGRKSLYKEGGLMTQTPHPVKDKAGNSYIVGQSVTLTGPKYSIIKFPVDGSSPQTIAKLPTRWRLSPCYMHSLGITENYIILVEMPLAVSVSEIMSDMFNNLAFIDGMKWHQESVFVHLFDLRTQKPVRKKFTASPMFLLHIANCYEDANGSVVMDFPCYADSTVLHEMYINKLREPKGAKNKEFCDRFITSITRLVLPLNDNDSRTEIGVKGLPLSTTASFENPLVNPVYHRRKHRYIYGMGVSPNGADKGQVTKLDVETGEVKMFMEDQLYIADPIFVPRPGAADEDDGVLAVVCVRSDVYKFGCLVFLDAKTMTEVARVTYQPQAVVPMPMHGLYIPNTLP
uniref:Carotenoid isomerooxygenase-like n=2 Tax=Hirondellea gigas TaxID=1518452 RepID=A0A6A7FX94_9CRUS